MFWRFGGYASVSTIDTLLDKPDVSLEDLLDETELIQELKQHNSKLIEYLREDHVLKRLLDYVIAPSPVSEDRGDEEGTTAEGEKTTTSVDSGDGAKDPLKTILDPDELEKIEKNRLKHAYVACEILSSEIWSILESVMLNTAYLRDFWGFLRRPAPLDSAQASYFTKVNETLFDKKTEDMLEFFKSLEGIIPAMLQHVDNPMVMDLLLKIISLEKAEGGQGTVDWLKSQDLIPMLLSFLSPESPPSVQTSAGDFLKAIITISANATQNDQSCIGPNSLTRQLVSGPCVESLVAAMLKGGNPLTVGVGIVIEVIRKNNSDYDPEGFGSADSGPSTYDPIYLGTLLRIFATHIPDFMDLIRSSRHAVAEGGKMKTVERGQMNAAWGSKIEPLGFDRFKTCELMAELLHCSNMALLNEPGSDEYIRQRDAERERMIRDGAFGYRREGASGMEYHDSTGDFGNGSTIDSTSGEDPKVFEVTNAGEDDGFEDVTSSGLLVDRAGESVNAGHPADAEEPSDAAPASQPSRDRPVHASEENARSSEQHTRNPFDEPTGGDASSPRSNALSPTTSGLTGQMTDFKLEDEQSSGQAIEHSLRTQLDSFGPAMPSSERPTDTFSPSASLSPHPEDIPPPLFTSIEESRESQSHGADTSELAQASGPDALGASQTSEHHQEPYHQFIQLDINGQPVVGDYLKIMFVENQVVPTILGFFFRFPWNNFLHNVVYDVVQQVFNGPMDRGYNRMLAIDVFDTGRITEQIVEGQRRSDETQRTKHIRLGYMGHLTLIAEEVVKFSERHPPELLSETVVQRVLHPDWVEYVEQTLSATRERDNAILGGVRPEVSVGQRQAVLNSVGAGQNLGNSSALADAGLNGGGNSNFQTFDMLGQGSVSGGAFGLGGNSNSLLSGFGSSSDDEDEEMEDRDDGTSAELPMEGDQHDASSSARSQPIPILPPPPAPLSTGPSRARRQLAARLAAQKQQAAEHPEAVHNREETGDGNHAREETRWASNPFVISGLDDEAANGVQSPSTAAFPSTNFASRGQDEERFSSPAFPESGFSPPEYLSSTSSEGHGEGRAEGVRRKVRIPLEVDDEEDEDDDDDDDEDDDDDYDDDDDDMGEMVGPSMSAGPGMMDSDADEEDAILNESLGYPNLFGVGRYNRMQRSHGGGPHVEEQEDQNDSSDGEDDGLVEILVPGRKAWSRSR